MNFLVVWTVVKVEHEHWKLEDLRVENNVPENKLMFANKALTHQNLISSLRDYVKEFFIESDWRQ